MREVHVFDDAETLSQAAARLFIDLAHQALTRRGRFTVALSGGGTPRRLYEILADDAHWPAIPWDRVLVLWGDDRAVGPDHPWSNYGLVHAVLLDQVPIPRDNVLRIQGELGAHEASRHLDRDLALVFGDQDPPCFDLVLLGLGPDGHTASLFPGSAALDAAGRTAAVPAPDLEPRVERITLTLPVLNSARVALFLVAGRGKEGVLQEILDDPAAPKRYPAARVRAPQTLWYVERAALGPRP